MVRPPIDCPAIFIGRHLVAVLLLFIPGGLIRAETVLEDDEAMEAMESFLADPNMERLHILQRQHGRSWVRHNGKLLTANHVDWSGYLDEADKQSYIKALEKDWEALKSDSDSSRRLPTLANRDYVSLRPIINDTMADVFFKESTPQGTDAIPALPGERIWSRHLGPGARCLTSGTSPLLIQGRRLNLLDPKTGMDIRLLDIPGQDPLEIHSDTRGAWIFSGRSLWRLDHLGKTIELQLPEGETLAGSPLIGPDGLFAPLRTLDDPCTTFMAMWTWPEGRLVHHHRIFTRADYKGRMRGIGWIPGPLDARGFYYCTQAGALLRCDTLDGQPWELLEYPSLDAVDLADRYDDVEDGPYFHQIPGSLEWICRPQDCNRALRLNPLSGTVTECDVPRSPQTPQGDDRSRRWTLGERSVSYLIGDCKADAWHRLGPLWLQVQKSWVHGIAPLNESQSPATPMTSARLGRPDQNSAEAARDMLASCLTLETPPALDAMIKLLNHSEHLPEATEWFPAMWNRMETHAKLDLWRHWRSTRAHQPWPLHGGLNIPHAYIDAVDFQGQAGSLSPSEELADEMSRPEALSPWIVLPPISLPGKTTEVSQTALTSGELIVSWPWWSENPVDTPPLKAAAIRSVTEARTYWPFLNARWLGVHVMGRRLAALELDDRRCFLHIRSGGRRWKSTLILSPMSRAWCLEDGILVLDEGEGKGHLLSDTGRLLFSFSLLDHGPHQVHMKPHGVLLTGQRHAISLMRLNRFTLFKNWKKEMLGPVDRALFPVVWGSPPDTGILLLQNPNPLRHALLLGVERLATARKTKQWNCSLSHIPLKADGHLNEPYKSRNAFALKGLPGSKAYAAYGQEGLILAVIVPDAHSSRLVSRDGVLRGDALRVAWDPLSNARFHPEPDDRGLVLGLPDPDEPRKIEALGKGQRTFGGECEIRRDEGGKRTIYELFIPWSDLGHRLPLRLDLGVVNDDGEKSWHSLGEGITERDFIPGFMPLLTPED